MKHVEGGIEPDVEAEIGDYKTTNKDGVVEKALEELLKQLQTTYWQHCSCPMTSILQLYIFREG